MSISGFQPLKSDFVAHLIMATNTSAFKAQRSIILRNTPTHPHTLNSNLRCSQRASLPFVQAVASHIILRKYIKKTLATDNIALCPNTHTYTPVHTAQIIITVIVTHTCRVISVSLYMEDSYRPCLLQLGFPTASRVIISHHFSFYFTLQDNETTHYCSPNRWEARAETVGH